MARDLTLAPFAAEGDWHSQLARYVLCARWARGRRVLDLSCGRGVGCEILRRLGAAHVVGVDTREEVVRWAHHQFGDERVAFHLLPPGGRLPFADGEFDLVLNLSSLWSPRREHLREVRRVLAERGTVVLVEGGGHAPTLGELLPVYDRQPPVEGREPADPEFRGSLFGPALTVVEVPSLTVHYRAALSSGPAGHSPRPERTLSEGGAPPASSARLHVYGLGEADAKATAARVIELPYHDVAGQLARILDTAEREVEVLRHNLGLTESELAEKQRLVADLDAEARGLREELAAVRDELSSAQFDTVTRPTVPVPAPGPTPYEREREAYIEQLWQSLSAWQRHAEELQAELEARVRVEPPLPPLEIDDATPVTAPPPAPLEARRSEREAELARLLTTTEAALEQARSAQGEAERRGAKARDEAARAVEEIRQRERRQRELEGEIEDSNRRWSEVSLEMADVLEERNQSQRDLAALEEQLSQTSVQVDKAKADEFTLEHDIREKGATIQRLERELVSMKVELSSREKENTRLMQGKAAMDRDLAQQQTDLDQALNERQAARAEAEAARAQVEAARARVEAARAQVEAARGVAETARAEAKAAREDALAARAALETAQEATAAAVQPAAEPAAAASEAVVTMVAVAVEAPEEPAPIETKAAEEPVAAAPDPNVEPVEPKRARPSTTPKKTTTDAAEAEAKAKAGPKPQPAPEPNPKPEPKPQSKPRRTRRKTTPAAPPEAAASAADAAESQPAAKPRRTRKGASAPADEAEKAVPAEPSHAAKSKPRRARRRKSSDGQPAGD